MNQDENKTKVIGIHKLKLKKFFDTKTNSLNVEISINNRLQKLIRSYCTEAAEGAAYPRVNGYERYLIKNILKSSMSWDDAVLDNLFLKNLVDKGKISISLKDYSIYRRIADYIGEVKDVIKIMEEIQRNEQINVDFNVSAVMR